MRRHLPGLLIFSLIVGFTAVAFTASSYLSDTPDAGLVPVVIDEPPKVEGTGTLPNRIQMVQYDAASGRLIARLKVDRSAIGTRSTVPVVLTVSDSENSQVAFVSASGEVLPGNSEWAVLVIEVPKPGDLDLRPNSNHYVAFSFGKSDGSIEIFDKNTHGSKAPIVYVHRKGPIILQ